VAQGEYTVAEGASQVMLDSLMYRTSFYDFGQIMTEQGRPMGYDRVRQKEIALKDYELQHLQEAFTRCASFRACMLDLYMFSMCVCACCCFQLRYRTEQQPSHFACYPDFKLVCPPR
jgi:hypothetical protein